jgi:hypothetical protein
MLVGRAQRELVVEPSGVVHAYPGGSLGQPVDPGGVRAAIARRAAGGVQQRADLRPDRASGALVARLPPPADPYTDYDVEWSFQGRTLRTGFVVGAGGTREALAQARAAGDAPAPDYENVEAPPRGLVAGDVDAGRGQAVGGGPRKR